MKKISKPIAIILFLLASYHISLSNNISDIVEKAINNGEVIVICEDANELIFINDSINIYSYDDVERILTNNEKVKTKINNYDKNKRYNSRANESEKYDSLTTCKSN
jgi:hypothetical protein